MLEAIIGRLRRPAPQPDLSPDTLRARRGPPQPDLTITLDHRYAEVVEAALALTRTTTEHDANAFYRTTLAHARLLRAGKELDAFLSTQRDNPFERNRVSEDLEAELPKLGQLALA